MALKPKERELQSHEARKSSYRHGLLTKRRVQVWRHWSVTLITVASDVLLALLVWLGAYVLQSMLGNGPLTPVAVLAVLPIVALWIGLRWLMGLYPGYGLGAVEQLRLHTYSVLTGLAIVAVFTIASHTGMMLSRLLLALGFAGLLSFAPLARGLARWVARRLGVWGRPAVIIGYKETSANTVKLLKDAWELGYKPVAVFDHGVMPSGEQFENTSLDEVMAEVEEVALNGGVDTVIFAMPYTRRQNLALLVDKASLSFRQVLIIPNLAGVTNSAVRAIDLAGTFAVEIKYNLRDPRALRTKRVLDLVATMLGGIVALSLLLVLALLVYLESGRPIFYRDLRMGKDGVTFSCIKFRTMVPGAENLLFRALKENPELREEYVRYHKLRDDPRVTRIGRFLRSTSLDELPQLWNVFLGEMSLVGPRPYLPRESEDIGDAQGKILRVSPGITGPWQVSGRSHTTFGDRVQMDIHYVRDWSVWLDLVLLVRTVKALLRRGAY